MSSSTLISKGDFIDTYEKIKQKGLNFILNSLNPSKEARVRNKWNNHISASDYWIIPEVQQRTNYKISGDYTIRYEDYVVNKYLADKENLKILSVGCGTGRHERYFAKFPCFSSIEGIDLSEETIKKAEKVAKEENLNICYHTGDFTSYPFTPETFDVILFSSSLHHFDNLNDFLKNNVKPILKKDGILIINEFCGPTRLQWTREQLKEANELLRTMPKKYKKHLSGSYKKKVYRPGLIRMKIVDPSEAVDSGNLISALHCNFTTIEETQLCTNIIHILLKGIAHNFLDNHSDTKQLLNFLFEKEDNFVKNTGQNDMIFGVYKK